MAGTPIIIPPAAALRSSGVGFLMASDETVTVRKINPMEKRNPANMFCIDHNHKS
jgi:hypothetical protein